MERISVFSSFILSIGYDANENEMEVDFSDGKTLTYIDVPIDVYTDFISSISKGRFWHTNIKDVFDWY